MAIDIKLLLQHRAINGWGLFWLVSIPMSLVMVMATMEADMSTGPGVSSMIQFSVRWAVPFIFLVAAASSLQILFPGPLPMWLLRNRKYVGLCFAVAMVWQGLFILTMSLFFREYYFEDVYVLRDELEGSIGYIFLPAMVVTSFSFTRKHLTSKQWKLIHKSGVYFLWAYAFSVYWWNLFYYGNPQPIDYVFYWMGFAAFAVRIAAWGRRRLQAARKLAPQDGMTLANKVSGGAFIAVGLLVSATGNGWREPVTGFLTAPDWSANLVLWLPYWPFEPFLSLFIIGLGVMLLTKPGARQAGKESAE